VSFFSDLTQRAASANLPFLLIGGNAVIAYGYPRVTRDLDLLVRESDRRKWDDLIRSFDFNEHQITRVFHMYNPLDRALPAVDLMVVDEGTFQKLFAGSLEHKVQEAFVRLPSLAHLIALKLHALKSGAEHRRELDFGDVTMLVQLNKIDLAAPEYRDILERYATDAIRTELFRRLELSGFGSAGA
jgi:hypothetical protein